MKFAIISDIHGNLLALRAVLADIARQGVDQTLNLGDILSGPLQPAETADLLMAQDFPTIRGNHERLMQCAGVLIVNPGSVGQPAYDDAQPYPHVIENGAPHPRYALLEKTRQGWQVDLRAVPYDHLAQARVAALRQQADWTHALVTGFAQRKAQ